MRKYIYNRIRIHFLILLLDLLSLFCKEDRLLLIRGCGGVEWEELERGGREIVALRFSGGGEKKRKTTILGI